MKNKDEIKALLLKQPSDLTKDELSYLFSILCFKIKEYEKFDRNISFEIHYRREYIIQVVYPLHLGIMSFRNEYIKFGDGCSGVSMATLNNTAELINVFVNIFASNILNDAMYSIFFDEDSSDFESKEEAQSLLKTFQQAIDEIHNEECDKQG